jgi:hypothetical protein
MRQRGCRGKLQILFALFGLQAHQIVRVASDCLVRTGIGELPRWIVEGGFQSLPMAFDLGGNAGLNNIVDNLEQLLTQCGQR